MWRYFSFVYFTNPLYILARNDPKFGLTSPTAKNLISPPRFFIFLCVFMRQTNIHVWFLPSSAKKLPKTIPNQTTSMEDDLNGRRPQRKTTSMEDKFNGRRPQWKMTLMEDDLDGRRLQWKTT